MAKLNQILAIEKGIETRVYAEVIIQGSGDHVWFARVVSFAVPQ